MGILARKLTVREVEEDESGRQDHVRLECVDCCPYDLCKLSSFIVTYACPAPVGLVVLSPMPPKSSRVISVVL